MEPAQELYRFGVALAVGALLGVERQFAGVRDHAQALRDRRERGGAAGKGPPGRPEACDTPRGAEDGEGRGATPGAPTAAPERRSPSPEAVAPAVVAEPPPTPAPRPGPAESAERQRGPADAPTPPPELDPPSVAGVRTFMLVSLAGATAGHLAPSHPWLLPAALLALGALLVSGYLGTVRLKGDLGLTSEVGLLLVFLLGGLSAHGETTLAAAAGVVGAGILALKHPLHALVGKLDQEAIHALLKFGVLTVVVLPVLPAEQVTVGGLLDRITPAAEADEEPGERRAGAAPVDSRTEPARAGDAKDDGPGGGDAKASDAKASDAKASDVGAEPSWWRKIGLKPRSLWLMVCLISGISFAGFVLGKVLGTSGGLLVTAALGGLASSTAVTVAYARRSQEAPDLSRRLSMGILLANAIMPARLLVFVALLDPRLAAPLALPLLGGVAAIGAIVLLLRWRGSSDDGEAEVQLKNPFEVGPAFKFGALFAGILVLVQVAQRLLGDAGLVAVGAVAGLVDVDSISLAAATQARDGKAAALTAVMAIVAAVAANTVAKGAYAVAIGAPALKKIVAPALALVLGVTGAALFGLLALR